MCITTERAILTVLNIVRVHHTEFIPIFFGVVGLLNLVVGVNALIFVWAGLFLLMV